MTVFHIHYKNRNSDELQKTSIKAQTVAEALREFAEKFPLANLVLVTRSYL